MVAMKATLLLCIYLACNLQDLSIAEYVQCSHGDIQLVGGESELEGRVQVCLRNNRNYQWWNVCNVGNEEARAVCRQLGYSEDTYIIKLLTRTWGLVLQMNCKGSEAELIGCDRDWIWSGDCNTYAGVHCESIPQNVTAIATGTSAIISWRPTDSFGKSALQIRYHIACSATVSISNVTYEHRVETQIQNSTFTVTLSKLLPSTIYMCCVSTNPKSTAACSSAMTGELAENQETPPPSPPNCSAVAGGLGALVVILILLLGVVSTVLCQYLMVLRQKNMATDINHLHTSDSAVNSNTSNEDRTLHNPSYDAPSMEIPLENPNCLYSTVGPDYEIIESENSTTTAGIEGREYSHLRH